MRDKEKNRRGTEPEEDGLGPFFGKYTPDCRSAWRLYKKGIDFNNGINLEETVKTNENFFIGKVCLPI